MVAHGPTALASMTATISIDPVVLIAGNIPRLMLQGLEATHCRVVTVDTGNEVLKQVHRVQPDVIVLEVELPDMAGTEVCQLLHGESGVGPHVPSVLLTRDVPTPDHGVAALKAGAWDVLRLPDDPKDLGLKLQIYAQAKRNIDLVMADAPADARSRLYSRSGLAQRARELGALLARKHEALACVVFVLENGNGRNPAGLLVRTARVSDVVGILSPTEFAVLAPATGDVGAVGLARRISTTLDAATAGPLLTRVPGVRVGYAVVSNLKYSPIDPIELLPRASLAVRHGTPEPTSPWVRGYCGPRP